MIFWMWAALIYFGVFAILVWAEDVIGEVTWKQVLLALSWPVTIPVGLLLSIGTVIWRRIKGVR